MTNLFGKNSEWVRKELPIHPRRGTLKIYYGSLLDNDDERNVIVPFDEVESIKPSFSGNYRMMITYKTNRADLPSSAKYIEVI